MLRISILTVLTASTLLAADCDRACLESALDAYLDAVVQNDPTTAPLSIGYRETENAMVQRPGSGVWEKAIALGVLQRRYFDPESGQAGFFGTMEEDSGTTIATLRLKVEDSKITEAEWVISREGAPGIGAGAGGQADAAFHDAQYLIDHAPGIPDIPPSGRLSRTELIAVANSYFDGLSARDGSLIIAHPGCVRVENGFATTQTQQPDGTETDCTSEGAMRNIFAVTARRYPLVDVEQQAVLGLVVFQRFPGVAMRRNLLSEWFYIEDGKIQSIYASMYYPDPDAMAPNWPPYLGNWPVLPAPQPE